jgi:multiple sugar transport system substrate-binding protein
MVVQWTDVPKKGADPSQSQVVGKLGYGRVPGLVIGGKIVHRAMMPVGRVVSVAASSKNKLAAYWVAKHIAYDMSLENVSTAFTGLDVNRGVHFKHPEAYSDFKSRAEAASYLDRVKEALADGYPEIFIPGAAQYEDALDLHVNKALAGQESPKQALDAVAKEWSAITDRLGRQKQTDLWHQALDSYKVAGLIK